MKVKYKSPFKFLKILDLPEIKFIYKNKIFIPVNQKK